MKGKISLKDFIADVKEELKNAQVPEKEAFFALQEVNLEVEFSVEVSAEGKVEFSVWPLKASVGADGGAHQTHKVTLKLTPFKPSEDGLGAFFEAPPVRTFAAEPVTNRRHTLITAVDLPYRPPLNGGGQVLYGVNPTLVQKDDLAVVLKDQLEKKK